MSIKENAPLPTNNLHIERNGWILQAKREGSSVSFEASRGDQTKAWKTFDYGGENMALITWNLEGVNGPKTEFGYGIYLQAIDDTIGASITWDLTRRKEGEYPYALRLAWPIPNSFERVNTNHSGQEFFITETEFLALCHILYPSIDGKREK